MMHWRHKQALERWAKNPSVVQFHTSRGIGEAVFKYAINAKWIEPVYPDDGRRWWDRPFQLTDIGLAALAKAEHP